MRLEDDPQHLPKPFLQLLFQLPPHDLLQGADGRLEEGGEEVVYLQNIRGKSFNEKRETKAGGKFGVDSGEAYFFCSSCRKGMEKQEQRNFKIVFENY